MQILFYLGEADDVSPLLDPCGKTVVKLYITVENIACDAAIVVALHLSFLGTTAGLKLRTNSLSTFFYLVMNKCAVCNASFLSSSPSAADLSDPPLCALCISCIASDEEAPTHDSLLSLPSHAHCTTAVAE